MKESKSEHRGEAEHSDLSVEVRDKVNRLKAMKDLKLKRIHSIDTFRNTIPDDYQNVVRKKNEIRQVVSDTRKVDVRTFSFPIRHFATHQCLQS